LKNIGLVDFVYASLEDNLRGLGFQVHRLWGLSDDECKEVISQMQAIVVRSRFPFDRDFLQKNAHLECIARWGSGLENIDLEAADDFGIAVVNAPEGNRQAVGEHALLLLLSMMRHSPRFADEVRQGIWQREANRGFELRGKKVGIIGYGNNGSAFARLLSGFHCPVLAYDAYRTGFSDDHIKEASLEQIYNEADVISLHLPLNDETRDYANDTFFAKITKPIYFINTARGPLVNPQALLNALEDGRVIRAALDVLPFEKSSFESIDAHPLLETFLHHPDILVSPHIAGWTHESNVKTAEILSKRINEIIGL
jgi:D-3-phosphoglycerate dehydrogenase